MPGRVPNQLKQSLNAPVRLVVSGSGEGLATIRPGVRAHLFIVVGGNFSEESGAARV